MTQACHSRTATSISPQTSSSTQNQEHSSTFACSRYLDLSNNNLRILYSGTFRGLRALRSLDLRSNYLHTTETSSFNELSCLTSLHTDDLRDLDNSIEIHAGILDGISRLNLLELPYFDNCVREEDVFKRLEFLTDLDLYENKIQILSSGIFRGL
jgi:Leucine Rich Repeat.